MRSPGASPGGRRRQTGSGVSLRQARESGAGRMGAPRRESRPPLRRRRAAGRARRPAGAPSGGRRQRGGGRRRRGPPSGPAGRGGAQGRRQVGDGDMAAAWFQLSTWLGGASRSGAMASRRASVVAGPSHGRRAGGQLEQADPKQPQTGEGGGEEAGMGSEGGGRSRSESTNAALIGRKRESELPVEERKRVF